MNSTPGYNDIKNEHVVDNYRYDAIGNLVSDNQEGLGDANTDGITWNVYGKIASIEKIKDNITTSIGYIYDATGNRIGKTVNGKHDWYVRDASGNVMAVYEDGNAGINTGKLTQTEVFLYGSSRVGLWKANRLVEDWVAPGITPMVGLEGGTTDKWVRGVKFFELSNHLGNVLVTVSDKKLSHEAGNGTVDYYNADVVTANDYYPFGMLQPGRKFAAANEYRYGFNGKENDNEVKGEGNQQDYGMRIYDPRLGRFLSVDPITADYPELTPYQFASNRPIAAIDLDGLEAKDLARELEPVRAQRKKEQQFGITYPESKSQRYLRYFVTGGLGVAVLGPLTASALTASTLTAQATATNVVLWVTNPANSGLVLFFAEATLNLVNPDPGYNIELGSSGGESVKGFKLLFKTKASKFVEATFEEGAKFSNLSEVNWFEKLLSEGNNVRLVKPNAQNGGGADFLVNGIKTEIKEIANITSSKLGDNIKSTIQQAVKQAGEGGNIIIDVTKQNGATKELLQSTLERLKGNAKTTTNYRIVGRGFELTGEIKQK